MQKYLKASIVAAAILIWGLLGSNIGTGQSNLAAEPIMRYDIVVEFSTYDALFNQLKKFSEMYGFDIGISQTTPDGKHYLARLWREDLRMNISNPFEEGRFRLFVYQGDEATAPEDVIKSVMIELEKFVVAVPGATFSVRATPR